MKVFISFIFILFSFFNISFSEETKDTKVEFLDIEKSIQLVITNQIKAFKSDDFKQSYSYASENIKRIFPSYLSFKKMIIESYPMIHKPKKYEFVELRIHAGSYFQSPWHDRDIFFIVPQKDEGFGGTPSINKKGF